MHHMWPLWFPKQELAGGDHREGRKTTFSVLLMSVEAGECLKTDDGPLLCEAT